MKRMRKKLITALIIIISLVLASASIFAYAADLPDFIPNTPVLFNDFDKALFSELRLSTGNTTYPYEEGSWRYYYWCAYQCQYNADYTVHVTYSGRKPMEVELYDADGITLLAEDSGELTKLDTGKYSYDCEFTYSLTEGHLYYYRIAFSGHNYDSCGDFSVSLVSTPGDRIAADEDIIIQISNRDPYTYDLEEYSRERLINDLTFIAIYNDGSVDKWYGSEHPTGTPSLRGCNIIFDYSDCAATVGEHTISAYYMGRKTSKTFYITGCIHQYSVTSETERTWLRDGTKTYTCELCSKEYTEVFAENGKYLFSKFEDYMHYSEGQKRYSAAYDLNFDKVINMRDFTILNQMYLKAERELNGCMNSSAGDKRYDPEYDLNGDGIINMRDYSLLM